MPRPRLDAHLVMIASSVTKLGGMTNLLAVDFHHIVPADSEFPKNIGTLDVFVRFFNFGCHPETLALDIWSLSPEGEDVSRIYRATKEIGFLPSRSIHDETFRVHAFEAPHEGIYAVRVGRLSRSRLRGVYWKKLRDGYFSVRRSS